MTEFMKVKLKAKEAFFECIVVLMVVASVIVERVSFHIDLEDKCGSNSCIKACMDENSVQIGLIDEFCQ